MLVVVRAFVELFFDAVTRIYGGHFLVLGFIFGSGLVSNKTLSAILGYAIVCIQIPLIILAIFIETSQISSLYMLEIW